MGERGRTSCLRAFASAPCGNENALGETTLCAVATSDGYLVDQHFGRAKSFDVYRIAQNGEATFIETRTVQRACKGELGHSEEALRATAALVADCSFALVARIGAGALAALYEKGVEAYCLVDEVESAISKVWTYRQAQACIGIFEEE